MKKMFLEIKEILTKKQDVVLCSILESPASSARKAGTKMTVLMDGTLIGTIGGGTLELRTIKLAKEILQAKKSLVEEVEGCEGKNKVYFQYLSGESEKDVDWISEVCRLMTEEQGWIIYYSSEDNHMKHALYSVSKGIRFGDGILSQVYDGKLQNGIVVESKDTFVYVEPIQQQKRVWIFGGGNVGRALVPILSMIDFDVNVFDNRPECAKKERFPGATNVICGDFCNINDYIQINHNDYMIVMTPNHRNDYEVLAQVVCDHMAYVGCIGSRKKAVGIAERLLAAGHTKDIVERIHMPIGIKLNANTPAEIAICIAAELINYRAEENSKFHDK